MRMLTLCWNLRASQHFTQPPAHYTEASLVKAHGGAGHRTSQYLRADDHDDSGQTLRVSKENKNLYVTELGEVVNRHYEAVLPEHRGLSFYRKYGVLAGQRRKREP
ncbi:MAG: hypothetical protein ACLUD2_15425 [Clostridium sp.]